MICYVHVSHVSSTEENDEMHQKGNNMFCTGLHLWCCISVVSAVIQLDKRHKNTLRWCYTHSGREKKCKYSMKTGYENTHLHTLMHLTQTSFSLSQVLVLVTMRYFPHCRCGEQIGLLWLSARRLLFQSLMRPQNDGFYQNQLLDAKYSIYGFL